MPDPDKRMIRKLKSAIKKRGNKHRRAQLKQTIADNPDEAAHAEADLGHHRSAGMNGLDNDGTRKRDDAEPEA